MQPFPIKSIPFGTTVEIKSGQGRTPSASDSRDGLWATLSWMIGSTHFFMQISEVKQPSAAEFLLIDLDRRQDDVLMQLDLLDQRISEVLESISPGCTRVHRAKKELAMEDTCNDE